MKRSASLFLAFLLLFALALPAGAAAAEVPPVTTAAQMQNIQKTGNVTLDLTPAELDALGYRLGDMVTLTFDGQVLTLPYCDSYSCVDAGQPVLAARSGKLRAAVYMGDFATAYSLAEKETADDGGFTWSRPDGAERVALTISLAEQGGYLEEYTLRSLQYSDQRADYPDLTDAQFANFRVVATTGMGANRLYRSATPINPKHNRNACADAAMAEADVTVIWNLVDTAAEAAQFDGYAESHYASVTSVCTPLGYDAADPGFQSGLADGLRFLSAHPGVYAIHCLEGKDRTGFVAALLECLMGAAAEEVAADYMETYFNYYGVAPGDVRYERILESGVIEPLKTAFGVGDLAAADLSVCAAQYLSAIGLTEDEILLLKENLAADRPVEAAAAVSTACQLQYIQKHGNVILDMPAAELDALGYRFGDVLTLSFLDQTVTLPYCDSYSCVDAGQPVLAARSGYLLAAVNMGDFASVYGVADRERAEDGSVLWSRPDGADRVEFTISMAEQGGYLEEYTLRSLQYSDQRADYPDLTDAQFANFRAVSAAGMGKNRLFRSSSPIDPRHGRSGYADAAMADAGVTVILNLADSAAEAAQLGGFPESRYASVTAVNALLGFDMNDADFQRTLAEGLRALAGQPGVYAVHCVEGSERAGYVVALLECLMGAAAEDVAADYMESFYNYYGITPADVRYEIILNNNLLRPLAAAFGVEDLAQADLAAGAERYLAAAGLNAGEIAQLKANLAADRPFCDVSDAEAAAVQTVKDAGWMGGTDAQHFSPAAALSRAQLAVILWRAAGQPEVDFILPFADAAADSWYAEAVRWAAAEGISNGVAPGVFAPDAPVTREQLAAMLYRYEKARGGGFAELWAFRLPFPDASDAAEWAYEPLCWLTMQGVFPETDDALRPCDPVSRGETAELLARWKDAA